MAATDDPRIAGPDQLSDDERAAVEALLFRLADDELVVAERYTDWQVRAPTVESDIAIANVAQDELGHARLWYDLLEDFGATEAELIFERDPADFRHATLVELPFEEGDWADAVVRSYCYDVAEYHRLLALEDTAYRPIATRVGKVLGEEDYHRDHAENWVERLASGEPGTPACRRPSTGSSRPHSPCSNPSAASRRTSTTSDCAPSRSPTSGRRGSRRCRRSSNRSGSRCPRSSTRTARWSTARSPSTSAATVPTPTTGRNSTTR